MNERLRFYYYFIIGAIGGLSGWLIGTLCLSAWANATQSLMAQAVYGGLLGAAIGIAIAAYDGIATRSFVRFFKFGLIGLSLGAVAGMIALPLSLLFVFMTRSGGSSSGATTALTFVVGTICWLIFGGLIGFSEGISKGTQMWKGFLGGVTGGLCGGLAYEINRAVTGGVPSLQSQVFLAVSFLLLGGLISISVAMVTSALKSAWVEILDGKYAGRTYDVTKYIDAKLGSHRAGSIGSDQWSANVYLPGDGDVLPRHAEISYANGAPMLSLTTEASKRPSTFINGRRLTASTPLSDGDRLQFGSTNLMYRQKRR